MISSLSIDQEKIQKDSENVDQKLEADDIIDNIQEVSSIPPTNLSRTETEAKPIVFVKEESRKDLIVAKIDNSQEEMIEQPQFKRQNRAKKTVFPKARARYGPKGVIYSVYFGNFPQVVRDALALRVDEDGKCLWTETEPKTEMISTMDLVYKPVNFIKQQNFDLMSKRCFMQPERPFAYCHFENIHLLSTKPGLIKTLKEYYSKTEMFKKAGFTINHTMAMSYTIPAGDCLGCEDLNQLKKIIRKIEKKELTGESLSCRQLEKNFWILKPENENRGRGIEIATGYREIVAKLYTKTRGENYIVQKYIERPLLYKGRKFDLRVLAVIDNEKNLWLYKPCYLRTSSAKYTLDNQSKFIHLTNNCFQMNSDHYEEHEVGNQIAYSDFLDHLDTLPNMADFKKPQMMQMMKDIMIDCHLAASPNLDPRKRPGYKFEIVGFDFLIDEDLRVWLIEVNTCPFLGPVLVKEQPNFMLDLLDDTFKLTIDRHFFGRTLLPNEIETETAYEFLCNGDGTLSKRTKLAPIPSTQSSNPVNRIIDTRTQSEKMKDQLLIQFPESLYPSKEIHEELIQSQIKTHENWLRIKSEEQIFQAKAAKARAAKQMGIVYGSSVVHAYAPHINGLQDSKFTRANKHTPKQSNAREASTAAIHAQNVSRTRKTLPTTTSKGRQAISYNKGQEDTKRTRSALGGSTGRQESTNLNEEEGNKMREEEGGGVKVEGSNNLLGKPPTVAQRKLSRKPLAPPAPPVPFNLVEQVSQTLQACAGSGNFGIASLSQSQAGQQEQPKKAFAKLFSLVLLYLGHAETTMQAQGLQALVAVASSHFILFLQEKNHLLKLLHIAEPNALAKELLEEVPGAPHLKTRTKVVECVAEMCRTQAHSFFRAAILNSRPIFKKVSRYLLRSLELQPPDTSQSYVQLLLALCLGADSGVKGFVNRTRRSVYIPGETQEQRRLKRRAISNGALLIAHVVTVRRPEFKEQLSELVETLEDSDVLLHFLVLLNFICTGLNAGTHESPSELMEANMENLAESLVIRESSEVSSVASMATTPEYIKYVLDLQNYVQDNIINSTALKLVKLEADRLIVQKGALSQTKNHEKYSHNYCNPLKQEFCPAEGEGYTIFGIQFIKEQFEWAIAVAEKRNKIQPTVRQGPLAEKPSNLPASKAMQDFQEVLPVDAVKLSEAKHYKVSNQSPLRTPMANRQSGATTTVAYRGTLINQLKKGLLIDKEQQITSESLGSDKKSNKAPDQNLKQEPSKELQYRNNSRVGGTWKSMVATRVIENPQTTRKGQVENKKMIKKGNFYNTNKGAMRASLGLQDFVQQPNLVLQIAPQERPFASQPPENPIVSPKMNSKSEESPMQASPLPTFINSAQPEPASLVYAPMLSQPTLAKSTVQRVIETVNSKNEHLPSLNDKNYLAALKESSKRSRPKYSQFQDQYERVTAQARELAKARRPGARLQEDYKKALKALGEMQSSMEKQGGQASLQSSLTPYLESIAAVTVKEAKPSVAMKENVQTKHESNRSQKSLSKVASVSQITNKVVVQKGA